MKGNTVFSQETFFLVLNFKFSHKNLKLPYTDSSDTFPMIGMKKSSLYLVKIKYIILNLVDSSKASPGNNA